MFEIQMFDQNFSRESSNECHVEKRHKTIRPLLILISRFNTPEIRGHQKTTRYIFVRDWMSDFIRRVFQFMQILRLFRDLEIGGQDYQ